MELLAVIVALEALKKKGLDVHIYTDSQYVQKSVSQGWVFNWEKKGFKNIKNPDLWKRFLTSYKQQNISFHWVKGHAGIPENERCDELATHAARTSPTEIDGGYEVLNP